MPRTRKEWLVSVGKATNTKETYRRVKPRVRRERLCQRVKPRVRRGRLCRWVKPQTQKERNYGSVRGIFTRRTSAGFD